MERIFIFHVSLYQIGTQNDHQLFTALKVKWRVEQYDNTKIYINTALRVKEWLHVQKCHYIYLETNLNMRSLFIYSKTLMDNDMI